MNTDNSQNTGHGDILVIDDNISNLKFLVDFLTLSGYRVRPASDGELALRSVQVKRPELILLDYKMPGMDGLEVCEHLKGDPATRDIPIIFLSGLGETDIKVKALEAGAIDYVTKPIVPPELLAKIENHLQLFRLQRQLALQTEELSKEIEERKLAEKKTARISQLLDKSLNEIFTFDSETLHFIDVNQEAITNLGYSLEELQGMTPLDFNAEFTAEGFAELVAPLRSGIKGKIIFTTIRRRKDGTTYPVEVHLQLMPEDPPVFMALNIDITERQQLEQKYQEVVEGTTDLITQVDAKGDFLYCNHMGRNILGYDPEQLIGESAFQFVHPDDRERTTAWFENCANNQQSQASCENRQVNLETGRVRDLLWTINFHYDELGNLASVNGIGRDVTEQKKREEQILLNEKLATIAGLAAGVAHEINTPLSAILQSHQLIAMGLSPEEAYSQERAAECNVDLTAVQEYFKRNELDFFMDGIRDSALKASHIIKSLLDFSRPQEGSFTTANLEEIMESALLLSMTDYEMKKKYSISNIEIIKEYDHDLPPVVCVATEIEQVIINLIKNSAQSLAQTDFAENPRIILRLGRDDERVLLEVEDNGPGIAGDVKKYIFDPFFTTREVGTGTGLGLAVAHTIVVDKHHGKIRVESEPGQGATFLIELSLRQTI